MHIGKVYKITYIVFLRTKKKKKKVYNFIGLCFNKKQNYFSLKNTFKGEKIIINFDEKSPVILKTICLNLYPKIVFRLANLKIFKKFNSYFDDYKNKENLIISNFDSFKKDYFFSAYFKKKLKRTKKKLRRFKKKYSFTENWKGLKIFMTENEDFFYQ